MKDYWHYVEERLELEKALRKLKKDFVMEVLEDLFGEKDVYELNGKDQSEIYNKINVLWKGEKLYTILKEAKMDYRYDMEGNLSIRVKCPDVDWGSIVGVEE